MNVRIEPYPLEIAGESVDLSCIESKIDFDESLRNLFDTAENYFSLMGRKVRTVCTGDFHVDIPNLYCEFKEVLPKGVDINIDVYQNRSLGFELYNCRYDFPDEFIWFPVCGIEKMSEPVANIFKRFVSFLASYQEIPFRNKTKNWTMSWKIRNLTLAGMMTSWSWQDDIKREIYMSCLRRYRIWMLPL